MYQVGPLVSASAIITKLKMVRAAKITREASDWLSLGPFGSQPFQGHLDPEGYHQGGRDDEYQPASDPPIYQRCTGRRGQGGQDQRAVGWILKAADAADETCQPEGEGRPKDVAIAEHRVPHQIGLSRE